MRTEADRIREAISSVLIRYRLKPHIARALREAVALTEPDPDADVIARILDGPEITPREAFDGGFDAGSGWFAAGENFDSPVSPVELAWEHFQAERMKAAASTEEPCG